MDFEPVLRSFLPGAFRSYSGAEPGAVVRIENLVWEKEFSLHIKAYEN